MRAGPPASRGAPPVASLRREALELPGIGLGEGRRICAALRCPKPNPDQALGESDRAGDPIDDRNAGLALEVAGEIGHAGAAEHDRLGAVLDERTLDLLLDRARAPEPGSSSASTGTSAARTRAQRAASPYFTRLCSIGAIERDSVVTTLNFAAIRLAIWNAASPMPTTGASVAHRAASSPVSSKQAMTKASALARLADLLDEARNRERLVEIAFDAGRPEIGIDRCDLDARRSCGLGRRADLLRHRAGGVRIDDVDTHALKAPQSSVDSPDHSRGVLGGLAPFPELRESRRPCA